MKRLSLLFLTLLTMVSSVTIAADIPTGLVRIKNRRTSTAYLTTTTNGEAKGATKAQSGLSQIWIIEGSGTAFTVRSANTGQYLQATFSEPADTKTTLYIAADPNASNYVNISSASDFSGSSCLNLGQNGSTLYKWNNSNDQGSMWTIQAAEDVTEDEVRQHFAETTGYVSTLEEGKYYRFISSYGRAMYDTDALGGDIKTDNIDASNIAQYWTLTQDGNGWRIQNVLTQRYLVRQTTTSAFFHTTTAENMTQFNLEVAFNIKAQESKWDSKWTIFFGSDSRGLHDASSQSHGVVLWSTNADASVWSIQQAEVSQEDIDAARENLNGYEQTVAEYNDIVAKKKELQTALDNLFEDKACTTLKADIAALSDDDLAANADFAALTKDMQAMVLKIKNNTWQQYTDGDYTADYERFFRIADYKVYSHDEAMANASNFYMSNPFGRLSGPTGIVANQGDIIYVYVGARPKTTANLYIEAVSTDGVSGNHPTGQMTQLQLGLNVLQYPEQKILYVLHRINDTATGNALKLSFHPDIPVHIEGGALDGYWDATRGMTNADWKLLQKDLLKASPYINLKTERLVFQMDKDLVLPAVPTEMEGLMHVWNTICANEDRYMGVEDFEGRYNNVWNCFSGASSYMHATNRGTWYSEGTIATIMNYEKMITSAGNLWGPSHEIGHNHQGSINVIGTTESSNNLFSNINTFESGIQTSRRWYPHQNFEYMTKNTPWLERDIWMTTGMFYQLYLYFHVQHHDDNFLPNLFRALRKSPINKWSGKNGPTSLGKDDYLHLAKKICDVAKADLSEFFDAYGMFIPVDMLHVGDYSNYDVTTTQTDIDNAKKYMQKYEKKLGNIMFIDDRVIKKRANPDNIFGCIPASDGYKRANEEYPFLMASATSAYVGGDYESFTEDAEPVTDDWYKLTNKGKTITFQGTKNYAGHKFYDLDGNLIWATNKRSVTGLPACVTDLGYEKDEAENIVALKAIVVTANYDMTDTPCTNVQPQPDAIRNLIDMQKSGKKEIFDLTGRRVQEMNKPGLYIVNGRKVVVK